MDKEVEALGKIVEKQDRRRLFVGRVREAERKTNLRHKGDTDRSVAKRETIDGCQLGTDRSVVFGGLIWTFGNITYEDGQAHPDRASGHASAWSPDGKRIVAAGASQTVNVYELAR